MSTIEKITKLDEEIDGLFTERDGLLMSLQMFEDVTPKEEKEAHLRFILAGLGLTQEAIESAIAVQFWREGEKL